MSSGPPVSGRAFKLRLSSSAFTASASHGVMPNAMWLITARRGDDLSAAPAGAVARRTSASGAASSAAAADDDVTAVADLALVLASFVTRRLPAEKRLIERGALLVVRAR